MEIGIYLLAPLFWSGFVEALDEKTRIFQKIILHEVTLLGGYYSLLCDHGTGSLIGDEVVEKPTEFAF